MNNGKICGNSLYNKTLESYLSPAMPFLTSFLAASETVCMALLCTDGMVRFANPALSEC